MTSNHHSKQRMTAEESTMDGDAQKMSADLLLSGTDRAEQESILLEIQQQQQQPTEYSGPFDVPEQAAASTESPFVAVDVDYAKDLPEKPQYLCTPIAEEDDETASTSCDSHHSISGDEDEDSIVQEQRRLLAFYAQKKQEEKNTSMSNAAAVQMALLGDHQGKQVSTMAISDEDVLREQERLLQECSNTEKNHHKEPKINSKKQFKGSNRNDAGPKIVVRGYEKAAEAISLGQAVLRCCPYCRIVLQVDQGCRHLYCTNCEQVSHVPEVVGSSRDCRRRVQESDYNCRGKSIRN